MSLQQKEADSDVESEEASEWLLGFVEPPRKRTDLLRHRFPSKVGGRPAWLDPLYLPTEEQLTCRVTGKPLDFLLQVPSRAATRRVVHESRLFAICLLLQRQASCTCAPQYCGSTSSVDSLPIARQVYAPVEDNPAAFHRTMFLFISPEGDKVAQAGAGKGSLVGTAAAAQAWATAAKHVSPGPSFSKC
jgi:pre-rRNA-processing protein TSR4